MTATAAASIATLSSALAVILAAAAIIGGVVAYLIKRRSASGSTGTSDAATLWSQSQAMRDTLVEEKLKAETQRDKLMELQTSSIIPMMSQVIEAIGGLAPALDRIYQLLDAEREVLAQRTALFGVISGKLDAELQALRDHDPLFAKILARLDAIFDEIDSLGGKGG